MRIRICGLATAILATAGCGSSTAPAIKQHNPPISFLAGNGQTDTVQALLQYALIVRVGSGPSGQSSAHQVIRFQSVADSGQYRALVEPLIGGIPQPFLGDSTDAGGEVGVVVTLGQDAGPAQIVVSVPEFGYVDTARFTVLPGHAVGMFAAPNDTNAYLNGTVTLRTAAVDRYGNPRNDPVSFLVLSGLGTLNGSTLTVQEYGPIQVVGTSDGYIDTTTVFGVPTGSIAASGASGTGIFTFNLDGSGLTQITGAAAGTLKWAPNGSSLVFDQVVNGLYGATGLLQGIQLNGGQVTTLVNSSIAVAYPQYSRDGQWIYYDAYSITQPMWRVHPDGTGNSLVNMVSPEGLQFPSPSSDGTQVSYILGSEIGDLKILTLSSGTVVDLGVKGVSDVWSPTGNVIAYLTLSNTLATINSDGTGQKTIASGPYGPQFDWSPDGAWLIARNTATSRLELILVATQLVIPLDYTSNYGSPTWH
jgi:Tol biopolymer transport system component